MKRRLLDAVVDAITTGFWNEGVLALEEFEAIHEACAKRCAWLEREHANAAMRALAKVQRDTLLEAKLV